MYYRRDKTMKIGFIGLGIMGKPMAKNILKKGYTDLLVSDHHRENIDEVVACGAKQATPREIGESCDVVMTMLPNSPHVKSVMLGEDGIARYMKAGQVFIDMSSINPVASKEIAAELAKKGVEMLDAPVSGGEPKAIDGTLAFMVGGKQEVFDKYKPLLETMGTSVVRCGDVGAGNTTKLANQMIVACNIRAVAEALTLAQMAGVDPQKVYEAIMSGRAGSTVLDVNVTMIIAGNDKPFFKIDLHIKDLTNAPDCGHAVGAPMPMTASVREVMEWMHSHEGGGKDHSAIAQYYEYLTGIKIGR